jgi:4-hydroxy-tetrahydrodipicolinate synthase
MHTAHKLLTGSMVALITPFDAEGRIDDGAFVALIERQIANNTSALIPCGTTGESATLTTEEHLHLIDLTVKTAKGRVPVIAGTGSNNTKEAVYLTKEAERLGADAALIITPYYNKPTEQGLYHHFKTIHENTTIPLVLYDVPSRTVTRLDNALVVRLAKDFSRIIGLKDATGDVTRPVVLGTQVPSSFIQVSGDDASTLPYLLMGGMGAISVTANVAPTQCADVFKAAMNNDWHKARLLTQKLMSLHHLLFIETSPAPVKFALSRLGLCQNHLRLPLWPLSSSYEGAVVHAMHTALS